MRFEISSERQSVEVDVGENKEIDLNGDGKSDVRLLVNLISDELVSVEIELVGVVKNDVIEEVRVLSDLEEVKEESDFGWLIGIVLVLVVGFFGLKRFRFFEKNN